MLELFKAIGLGLVVILPLANPLTTVALFLGLAGNMSSAERNRQSFMASVYVFIIMMVAWYGGQVVMNTFGISIPGLRIAGGLIVAFIGFRMLFPPAQGAGFAGGKAQIRRVENGAGGQYRLCAAGDAEYRGSGDHRDDHQLRVNGEIRRRFCTLDIVGGAAADVPLGGDYSVGLLAQFRGHHAAGG